MTADSYGSHVREKMKQSMAEPFVPLNKRQPKSYIPLPRLERRRNLVRRWWYAHNEEVGMFLWMIVIVMVCTGAWWIYGTAGR